MCGLRVPDHHEILAENKAFTPKSPFFPGSHGDGFVLPSLGKFSVPVRLEVSNLPRIAVRSVVDCNIAKIRKMRGAFDLIYDGIPGGSIVTEFSQHGDRFIREESLDVWQAQRLMGGDLNPIPQCDRGV